MNSFLDFIAIPFAANAIVTAWLYGSLFENVQAYFKKRKDKYLGELLTCPMCIAYHICFWLAVLLWLPAQLLPGVWPVLPRAILYSFAATTMVHYMQGVLPLEDEDESSNGNNDQEEVRMGEENNGPPA